MNATSVLGNFFVRVGLVPAAALFLAVLFRRLALRNGRTRPPLLSLETFNVGFDLFVLTVVTSFTALIDRSSALAQTSRELTAEESKGVPARGTLAVLHSRADNLANGQLVSVVVLLVAIVLAVVVASLVSEKGYNPVPIPPKGRNRGTLEEPTLTRRGVVWPLGLGLLSLIMSLVTSR